uniref:Uncharacterized protein n=1 Tax=Sipha flava TaxID=143950 RepID=A0A2S2PVD0_9HEMI
MITKPINRIINYMSISIEVRVLRTQYVSFIGFVEFNRQRFSDSSIWLESLTFSPFSSVPTAHQIRQSVHYISSPPNPLYTQNHVSHFYTYLLFYSLCTHQPVNIMLYIVLYIMAIY